MNNSNPIYIQLMENIKEKIINGEYEIGEFIASERKMAEQYKINRMTVRKALKILIDDGYLETIKGKGTVVKSTPQKFRRVELGSGESYSLSNDLKSKGIDSRRELVSLKKINNDLEHLFKDGNYLYELIRITYIGNEPYAIQVCYLPELLFPDVSNFDFENNSIYKFMENYGYKANTFETEMKVGKLEDRFNNFFKNYNRSYFICQYKSYESQKLLEYTRAYYNPKFCQFNYVFEIWNKKVVSWKVFALLKTSPFIYTIILFTYF